MPVYSVFTVKVPEGRMPGCPLCGHAMEDGMRLVVVRDRDESGNMRYALGHQDCAEESED